MNFRYFHEISSLVLAASLACAVCIAAPIAQSDSIPDRLDALIALDRQIASVSTRERRMQIEHLYAELFADEYSNTSLSRRTDEDIDELMRAAAIRAFHSLDVTSVDDLRATYTELEARGIATRYQAHALHKALLWHRRFEEAAAVAARISLDVPAFEIERLDQAVDTDPHVWLVGAGGARIEQRPLDIGDGPRIIMVAQPNCGPSQRAMAAIASDPETARLFGSRAAIVIPAKTDFDIRAVQRWNSTHPWLAMVFANAEREWPQIDTWETPVFYFFSDGNLRDTIIGWPNDDRIAELHRVALAHGM